jgi:hypothetical protein
MTFLVTQSPLRDFNMNRNIKEFLILNDQNFFDCCGILFHIYRFTHFTEVIIGLPQFLQRNTALSYKYCPYPKLDFLFNVCINILINFYSLSNAPEDCLFTGMLVQTSNIFRQTILQSSVSVIKEVLNIPIVSSVKNTTNLLPIKVATFFDLRSHPQANYKIIFEVHQVKLA